jgi:hypothetical protein
VFNQASQEHVNAFSRKCPCRYGFEVFPLSKLKHLLVNTLLTGTNTEHWNDSRFIFAEMIRKTLVMIMLSLYGASAIGVPLHFHYCKGELQHVTIFTQKECDAHEQHNSEAARSPMGCCMGVGSDHCSLAENPDCCNDELDLIQLDDEAAAVLLPFSLDVEVCAPAATVEVQPSVLRNIAKGYHANAPPAAGPKIYLANCSFVFYG